MANVISRPAPKHILVGPVRLAFPNIFRPRTTTDAEGKKKTKFDSVILIPKTADDIVAALRADIKAAWTSKFGENPLPKDKQPLRDGDEPTTDDPNDKGKFPGYIFLNTSAREDSPPAIMDAARAPIVDPNGIQSGDFAYVLLNPYPFATPDGKSKGVAIGLVAIQFYKRGEPIGTAKVSADDARDMFANLPAAAGDDVPAF